MSVTNKQLIALAMIENNINEECHTYAKWQALGYQVKKGSKALFQTTIWKHTTKENKDGDPVSKMFMKKSSFFGASQVEKK